MCPKIIIPTPPHPPSTRVQAGNLRMAFGSLLSLILDVLQLSQFYWWCIFKISRYASFPKQLASSRLLPSLAWFIRVTSYFQFYLGSPYSNQSYCLKHKYDHIIPRPKHKSFSRAMFKLCNVPHKACHNLSLVYLFIHSFIHSTHLCW